jgi:hypothetical protein
MEIRNASSGILSCCQLSTVFHPAKQRLSSSLRLIAIAVAEGHPSQPPRHGSYCPAKTRQVGSAAQRAVTIRRWRSSWQWVGRRQAIRVASTGARFHLVFEFCDLRSIARGHEVGRTADRCWADQSESRIYTLAHPLYSRLSNGLPRLYTVTWSLSDSPPVGPSYSPSRQRPYHFPCPITRQRQLCQLQLYRSYLSNTPEQ